MYLNCAKKAEIDNNDGGFFLQTLEMPLIQTHNTHAAKHPPNKSFQAPACACVSVETFSQRNGCKEEQEEVVNMK